MRTEIDIQKENVKSLIDLIKKNPELKIVPMVDSEIVADDGYSSWLGSFGKAEIDHIWNSGERIYFESLDKEELVQNILDEIPSEIDDTTAERTANDIVGKYEWEKVIVVWIGLP